MSAWHPCRVIPIVVLSALVFCPREAFAYSPYTHNWSANQAYEDAIDGFVEINGDEYPVRQELVEALRNWPEFYNAGVVGPDGFPDVTYGQRAIHPEETGQWYRHVLSEAWEAQKEDSTYTANEKGQILAFAYGFLTHGAGDMWAHTIVNEFSQGVFPSVEDIPGDRLNAQIAIRHLILDLVIGDATPDFDGNPERGPAPGGDVSDTSTPGISYDAPHRFLFETLVDPNNTKTPTADRGPILGKFIDLRAILAGEVSADPHPIEDAITAFIDFGIQIEDLEEDCNFEDFTDGLHDVVACPAGLFRLGFEVAIESADAFQKFILDTLADLARAIFDSYIAAWIDDIDEGFRNWSKLGLAATKALYDPQTRRDFQNEECEGKGDESELNRASCEDNVGLVELLFDEADPFINDHLLSMLGAPDAVGEIRQFLQDFGDDLGDFLEPLGVPNPIEEFHEETKEFAKNLIKDFVKGQFRIDVDDAKDFFTHPTNWLNVESVEVDLGALGTVTLNLFQPCDSERLVEIMGLGLDPFVPSDFPFPGVSSRLRDDAEFDPDDFPPMKNTITTAKLLLLDGPQLNALLSKITGRTISTYDEDDEGSNYMVDGLDADTTWLRSIDGDHAWRADGRPIFCNGDDLGCPDVRGDDCHPQSVEREASANAGHGVHPIWESCALRGAFSILFTDWENGDESFPANGDAVSSDPDNDPEAPVSRLEFSGSSYFDGVRTFVGSDNVFTFIVSDGPPGKAFPESDLRVQYRIYTDFLNRGDEFVTVLPGDSFSLTGADGQYFIDFQAEDPCHTFDEDDSMLPEVIKTVEFWLDTTPPAVTCNIPPFGLVFDTDDFSNVDYAVDDGAGSGVAGFSSTIDGYLVLPGVESIAVGDLLDMYSYYPGTRTVDVTATDNVGNTGTSGCTFEIHATPESLISNLARAVEEGLIKQPGTITSLRTKLRGVKRTHDDGQHNTEGNLLGAFSDELTAQRDKWVDAIIADRFQAYAQDRIDTHVLPLTGG